MLFFLIDAYHEDEKRIVLKLHPKLAPIKVAVFPLLRNKEDLPKQNQFINVKVYFVTAFDNRGNIGKDESPRMKLDAVLCYNRLSDAGG
jgi:glycyl-tRNA synthetase